MSNHIQATKKIGSRHNLQIGRTNPPTESLEYLHCSIALLSLAALNYIAAMDFPYGMRAADFSDEHWIS